MGWMTRMARSADLASGMMDRLGSSFAQDILREPETATRQYAGMIFRCAGCRDQEDCARLQAANDHLDQAPAYCRNKDLLESKVRA